MVRQPVSSTAVMSVGHDPATNTLEVEFRSGAVHQYEGVSAEEHAALLKHFRKRDHVRVNRS